MSTAIVPPTPPPVSPPKARADSQPMSGLRRAAILLVVLGDEAASAVYRNLRHDDLHMLTQEIAELGYVSPEQAASVLQDYYRLAVTQEYLAQGGPDYANQLLIKAFGDDGAKHLLNQVLQAQEANAANLDSLQKADPDQLVKFVEGEHPQTVALVLAHLGVKAASSLLVRLPEKLRAESVRRLAEMQQFSTEMVKKISVVLHKKLAALGEQKRRAYGGVHAVADMLNSIDPASNKNILEAIEQEDPKLALEIRNMMFTFDDLLTVADASIREILSQVDKKTLAMALKGASEELKNHFYKAMSSRAVEMLKEDIDALGPVRARQVQKAQQETVNLARKLEAEGKITLKGSEDDSYVV